MKHLNIIINPVERWFHYVKPLPIEMPRDMIMHTMSDPSGNPVVCWTGYATYELNADAYHQLDRLDILYGHPHPAPFPCEKCKKITCRGKRKCKGYGAWSYGISLK